MSSASDLLLHLRPCPLTVEFEQVRYTVPAMDAVEWIAVLDGPDPDSYEIFPLLAGREAVVHVEEALWEARATIGDVAELGRKVVSLAADRPWYEVMNLLGAVKEAWDVVHVNAAAGMSLAGWLDEVWSKVMAHIDKDKRASWIGAIQTPPKGMEVQVDFDAEERAFLNAMNAVMR